MKFGSSFIGTSSLNVIPIKQQYLFSHRTLWPAARFSVWPGYVFIDALHTDIHWRLFFYLTQDLDRIAEANELFDAVLTGSVDRDKKATKNATIPMDAPAKERVKSTAGKSEIGGSSMRKLSLYVGNFPWVRIILTVVITFFVTLQSNFCCFVRHSLHKNRTE